MAELKPIERAIYNRLRKDRQKRFSPDDIATNVNCSVSSARKYLKSLVASGRAVAITGTPWGRRKVFYRLGKVER